MLVHTRKLNGLVQQGSERRVFVGQNHPVQLRQHDQAGTDGGNVFRSAEIIFFDSSVDSRPRPFEPLEKIPGTRCFDRPDFLYAGGNPPLSGPTGIHKLDHPSHEECPHVNATPALVDFSARVTSRPNFGDAHR